MSLKTNVKNVVKEWMWFCVSPKATSVEKECASVLRKSIAALPPLTTSPTFSRAENKWIENRQALRKSILSRDPRNFLQWDVIQMTMFHNPNVTEFNYLQKSSNWSSWNSALHEVTAGNPPAYEFMQQTSGNCVHHAYSIAQFENFYKLNVASISSVFEFGGGYGSMARLLLNRGFKGAYTIFDLPEFSYLQIYFLSLAFPGINISVVPSQAENTVIILHKIEDLEKQIAVATPEIFIATWSISESALHIRENILPLIKNIPLWLIAYQHIFQKINNSSYFKQLALTETGREFVEMLIPHLKDQFYAFGRKK